MMIQNKNRALFIDRDGTINLDKHYVSTIENFTFQEGIFDLLKDFQQKGFLIIIATNQSGIARGFYSENDFQTLTDWMLNQFKERSIEIAKVYHCPHHPDFTGKCDCRKPNPGMIVRAIEEFNIDPVNSVLIGDKKSDILAGKKAGIGKNLYIQDILKESQI